MRNILARGGIEFLAVLLGITSSLWIDNNKKLADKLYLLRNHGLVNRNNAKIFGYNSRLDTIQAVVANYKLKNKLSNITRKRIKNASLFDKVFKSNPNVKTVKRFRHLKEVYHLYHINVKKRDELQKYLIGKMTYLFSSSDNRISFSAISVYIPNIFLNNIKCIF